MYPQDPHQDDVFEKGGELSKEQIAEMTPMNLILILLNHPSSKGKFMCLVCFSCEEKRRVSADSSIPFSPQRRLNNRRVSCFN